ncbi:lysozyme inhibitor LprI family protein [Candidatus Francisella endociliophora]|uniref:lysozyme inhibitor LprI family protein n=1 Tax=Candidatus Francisella endociliophora TaxID=653937 RepID=UPI0006942F51
MALLCLPVLAISKTTKCDGNTYEINECLKSQMQKFDTKLDKIQDHNIKKFKKYRDNICSDVSSSYKGGTYESVKYGNCIISLNKWYLKQLER